MYFTDDQTTLLHDMIRKIEERTGIELVTAVVGKCDNYPEIPWKAFALAASVSALALLAAEFLCPGLTVFQGAQLAVLFILGAGSAAALLSVLWPAFGRLFLDRVRAETEIDQYARAFFLERELFRTRGRTGVLVLAGLFERRVVIVPDSGVTGRLGQNALHAVINRMVPYLRSKDRFQALVAGLARMEEELLSAGFGPASKTGNEITDAVIQQKGADR